MNDLKKSFHIVADKGEMKYAQMIFALVSANENIQCRIFSNPKKYVDTQLSSDNYVLFIGQNTATSKNMTAMLDIEYDNFGVKYATHGKIAQIWRESIYWHPKKVSSFLNYYNEQVNSMIKLKKKYNIHSLAWDAFVAAMGGLIGLGVKKLIGCIIKSNNIKEAQYNLGIMLFVQDELENFMQIKSDMINK